MENKFSKKILNTIAGRIDERDKAIAGNLGVSKEKVQENVTSPVNVACCVAFNIQQDPGAVVELNEEVIKQVIRDWQKPYEWIGFPNSAFQEMKHLPGVRIKTERIRASLLVTLPTALVNAKGILKWREEK